MPILAVFQGLRDKLAIVGGIVLAVLAILAGARSAGRSAERAEQAEAIRNAVVEKARRDGAARLMSDDVLCRRAAAPL